MTDNETPAPQEQTFRFITGLGPTGPNQEIEFQVGYRIEDPNEMVMGRPKVVGTFMPFQHLTKEHLEHLRHQINGAIGWEDTRTPESIVGKVVDEAGDSPSFPVFSVREVAVIHNMLMRAVTIAQNPPKE